MMFFSNGMNEREFNNALLPISGKLYRFSMRFVRVEQEAEDILQEVMVKLWTMREKLYEYRSIEALAMTITRNLCLDKLKTRRSRSFEDLNISTDQKDMRMDPSEEVHLKDSATQIHRIIQDLPEQQRSIIQLRDIEGYEYEEIAGIMDMEINTVRVNLSRARKAVRQEFLRKNE